MSSAATVILVCFALIGALAYIGPNKLIDIVEGLLKYFDQMIKRSISDYIEIENVDLGDPYTFVMKDGSLMTLICHDGCLTIVGKEEFEEVDRAINSTLGPFIAAGGHAVQMVFTVDPDATERDIRHAQQPSRDTAARLQIDLTDMFEEEVVRFREVCSSEACHLALFTRAGSLHPTEQKQDADAAKELFHDKPLPRASDAPALFRARRALRPRHESFVSAVLTELQRLKMDCRKLEVHEACREIRRSIDPEFTAEDWRPCLVGDPLPRRDYRRDPEDLSGGLWPMLGPQLAPRDAHEERLRFVRIGDRTYAPMHFRLLPQEIQTFQKFFMKTVRTGDPSEKLPWRMSFVIEQGGQASWEYKSLASMLFGWSSRSNNSQIRNAIEHVKRRKREGATEVRVRIDIATWAPADDTKLLERRAAILARAAQSWGNPEVQLTSGDAVQSLVCGAIGTSLKSPATPWLGLLDDVSWMLPLYRPSSPWKQGAMSLRTPDGKPWAFQPHSPLQTSSITIGYAEPRSGKSVTANAINLALCLSPGITRLPLISIIDIGRASSGLISLLQNAVPTSMRHLFASIRMQMTKDFAVNPLDLQLGMDRPLEMEFNFQLNLLLTLVTPPGAIATDPAMPNLCRMALETVYRRYSRGAQGTAAKRYSSHMIGAEDVDAAIVKYAIPVDDNTTWWEITDALFTRGAIHEAYLAQRFAVPLLADLAAVVKEPQFQDVYGAKLSGTGDEPLLHAFSRMLSEAIRAYPILSSPTRFDLGEARVVSLDLADVAKTGSAAAAHQTAVCYMIARYCSARNFYLHEDDVVHFPTLYRPYQDRRIREIREDRKQIQYDEFHRTQGIESVKLQVIGDMREGGKYGVGVALLSQDIKDFDETMLSFATTKLILSRANESTVRAMDKIFGLSETLKYNVRNSIRPPGPNGATFVGMFDVKSGSCAQALNNSMGAIKLWAFSTTNEDAYVRDTLYGLIGAAETRRLLAQRFPRGSLLDELERRKAAIDQGETDSVIEGLIQDLVKAHQEDHRARKAA